MQQITQEVTGRKGHDDFNIEIFNIAVGIELMPKDLWDSLVKRKIGAKKSAHETTLTSTRICINVGKQRGS